MALHIWLMSAILALATALKLSGGHLGPILHSRVKYDGPYEKSLSITSKYQRGVIIWCFIMCLHLELFVYDI